jgi:predicted RNA polymerase sigma factor
VVPGGSDWAQIALLYDDLPRSEPTSIVRLNPALDLREAGWPAQALDALKGLHAELLAFRPFRRSKANFIQEQTA